MFAIEIMPLYYDNTERLITFRGRMLHNATQPCFVVFSVCFVVFERRVLFCFCVGSVVNISVIDCQE